MKQGIEQCSQQQKTRGKRLSDEQKGPRTKRRSGMDEPSLNISLDSSLEFRMNNIYDESDDDDDDAPGSNSIFDIAASLFLNIFIGMSVAPVSVHPILNWAQN